MSPAKVSADLLSTRFVLTILAATACSQGTSQPTSKTTTPTSSQTIVRHSSTSCAPPSGVGGANAEAIPKAFPKDFPIYAGASYQNVRTFVGTGGNTCTVTLDVVASSTDVTAYYQEHLSSGSWKVKGYDAGQGVLGFGRTDNARTSGTVTFLGHGTRTEVDIQYEY